MPVSIADLVRQPHLGVTVLAGSDGLDSPVRWAHVSELCDPTPWLEGGELLMTVGFAIPPSAEGQREYVTRLAERGIIGLALSTAVAPPLTRTMLATADARGLPVLDVATEVPFSEISRIVFASERDVHDRLLTHLSILDVMRAMTTEELSVVDLIERLERLSGYALYLSGPEGEPLLDGIPSPPASVREQLAGQDGSPVLEDGFVVRVPLARHPGASLVALQRAGAHPAGLVAVQHIASIVALELAKLRRARAIESGIAGSALHELLSGAAAPLPPERRLEAARFAADSEVQLVAIPASAARELRPEQLTERFFDQNVAAVSTCVGDAHFVLLDRRASLDALEDVSGLSVGVSLLAPLADGFGQLRRQALLALRAAQAQGGGVVRYSAEASAIVWLPTDDRGLLEVVDRILGPVLRYDEQSGSALLDSLRIYLEQDRSLSRSAALLFVHKHTLAYRLRRVEELTGRSLRSVRTMSDFWLGLEALRLVASEDDERRFP